MLFDFGARKSEHSVKRVTSSSPVVLNRFYWRCTPAPVRHDEVINISTAGYRECLRAGQGWGSVAFY